MIHDRKRLLEVIEEIVDWTVDRRRTLIAEIGAAFGEQAAEQIRTGLTEFWSARKG